MAAGCGSILFMATAAFLLGCAVFSNPITLRGGFVYDDKGTVTSNPTVSGNANITEIWKKDLWGEFDLKSQYSHKSWRPLATLTLRWNYQYAGRETLTYHVVNMIIHGMNSALAIPVCWYMKADLSVAFSAAMLFAAHPVHVESVACVTGRCDIMCSFFYFLGFVCYALARGPAWRSPRWWRCILMLLILVLFSPASLLSKELGIMLPYWCVAWDIFASEISLADLLLFRKHARWHIFRHIISLAFGVSLTAWRLWMNGGSAPDLGERQSPVALLPTVQQRFLSNAWQHVRHATFMTGLSPLCPDWSDGSVAFVASFLEWRAIFSMTIYASLVPVLYRLLTANHRCAALDLGIAWGLVNFVLSSNSLIRVGFILAERVLYLPSLGTSLAIAVGVAAVAKACPSLLGRHGTGLSMALVAVWARRCWLHAETYGGVEYLWPAARLTNPHSGLVIYELGMNLHNFQKYQESVDVMEEGFEQHPDVFDSDLQAHFILAEGYRQLNDCQAARETAKRGLAAIVPPREDGKIQKGEAYLHVTLSKCALSVQEAGKEAYAAVEVAHRQGDKFAYDYALEQATLLQHNLEKAGFKFG